MKSNIDIDRKYKYRDINKKSIVLDIGGFKGEWAFHISKKYGCQVHVFEPFRNHYYKIMIQRLWNSKISLYRLAVSSKGGPIDFFLTENADGHSIYDRSKSSMQKKVKKITVNSVTLKDFMESQKMDSVDLIKMNCEGAEIDILNSIDSSFSTKIKQITFSGHAPKITKTEDQEAAIDHIRKLGFTVEEYCNEQVSNRFYCYR